MLIFCFISLSSAMLYCSNSTCLSCESIFFLYRHSCLSLCPFDYLENSGKCDQNLSVQLFNEDFIEFYAYNSSFFNNTFNKFNTGIFTEETFPIPTRDRGLYFSSNRSLESITSLIPSPDITIFFLLRVFSPGTLFSLSTPFYNFLEISAEANNICINTTVTNQNITEKIDIQVAIDYNLWIKFSIKFLQNQDSFTIFVQDNFTTYSEETRYQDENAIWILGSSQGKGFTGFFAKLWVYNDFLDDLPNIDDKLSLCNFQEYYEAYDKICLNTFCNQAWPVSQGQGCIFNDLPGCDEAYGYLDSQCLTCENKNFTPPYCKCGEFCVNCTEEFPYSCSLCDENYTLISELCIRNCYNCIDKFTQIYEFSFYNAFQGYINGFQSGSQQETWSPFNNPDDDDPKFSPYRGFYFQGSQYFQSKNFSIAPKSFWAFWVKAYTFGCIWCSKIIKIYPNGYCELVLSNSVYNLEGKTTNSSLSLSWTFITISTDYLIFPETTAIYIRINNTLFETLTFQLLLRDRGEIVHLGADNTQNYENFTGFIYYLEYAWNYIPSTTAYEYNIFLSSDMSMCDYLQYYNDINLRCESCNSVCLNGCSTFGSCSLCEKVSCGTCANFTDTNCESDTTTCINSLFYFSDSNRCCAEGCHSSCSGPNPCDCVEINYTSKYSIDDICCFSECPTGYSLLNDKCTKSKSQILMFSFNKSEITEENDIYGNTLYNNNGGIPAIFRGYYYSSTSFASTSSLILSYEFSIYIWFKAIVPGLLLSINDLQVELTTSSIIVSLSSSFFTYLQMSYNWSRLKLQQYIDNTEGYLLVELLNSSSSTFIKSVSCNFFKGSLLLGAGFTGFLWRLTLYDYLVNESSDYTICDSTILSDCLWPCDVNKYFSLGTCYNCLPSCSSCRNSKNCNLCFPENCEVCADYETKTCDACYNSYSGLSTTYSDFTFNQILYTQQTDNYGNVIYFTVPGISYASGSGYTVPTPLAFRGYYFISSSLVQSTSISLTDTFNIAIWIKQYAYGCIFTMDNFAVYTNSTGTYINSTYTFTNNSGIYNKNDTYFFNTLSSLWKILRIQRYMQAGKSYASIDYYPDSGLTVIESIPCRSLSGKFTLGKPSSSYNSFTGFIYRIAIFTGNSVAISTINLCINSEQSDCIWNCAYGTYLDSIGTCKNCKYGCYACRNSDDCIQCVSSICKNCENYITCTSCIDNGNLNSGLCYCNTGYLSQMLANGTTYCGINSECSENDLRYRVDSCCYTSCPQGYTILNQECVKSSDTILDLKFDRLSTLSFADSYGNTYYANSSISSPLRGYYFSNDTNGNFSSLILAPNITLQIWVKVVCHGTFLAIENFVLSVTSSGFEITVPDSSYNSAPSVSIWDTFILQKYIQSDNSTSIRVIQQVKGIDLEFVLEENCVIWQGNIIFGKSTNKVQGFTGFIWRVVGINGLTNDILDFIVCSASITEECLWNCNINQYFSEGNCYSCSSSCKTCRNGNDCILCVNSICSSCSYYYNCTTCISNAALNNDLICECNDGYFSVLDLSKVTLCKLSGLCNSAVPNQYTIDQCCYTSCPAGYSLSGSLCTLSRSNIFDFHCDELYETIVVDDYSNVLTIISPPYPYIQRGYYMYSGVYINTGNFLISHSTTLLMWIRQYTAGFIYKFENMKVSTNNTGVILQYSEATYFFPTQIFAWSVLIIQRWTENSMGYIAVQIYPSLKYQINEPMACNFMYGYQYIGTGFSGYIWRIQWINGVYNDEPELVVCTASITTNCLWDCPLTSFFNSSVGACNSCLSSCSRCKQNYDCNLCVNSLCTTCNNYYTCSACMQNATLVNGVCECKIDFYKVTLSSGVPTCLDCAPTCQTACFGPNSCDCNDYNSFSEKLTIDRCCTEKCPLGFNLLNSECTRSISKIANFQLDRIEYNQWEDEFENIFYVIVPSFTYNFNTSQPIPVQNRGYYFFTTSFAETSRINMNFEFTIAIWIKIKSSGLIFSIDNLQLIYEVNSIKISQDSYDYSFLISSNSWEILIIKRWLEVSQSYFSLQFSGSTEIIVLDSKVCDFLDGVFVFGGGFEGFIWKIEIYNENVNIADSLIICNSSNCIWDCEVNEFMYSSACTDCKSDCITCVNSQDCNICPNSICRSCSDYQNCTSCADFASLENDICKCNITYYEYLLSPGYSVCYECKKLCYDYCSGPNACDCFDITLTTKYNLELCCFSKCPSGFELIGNECVLVNSTVMDYIFDSYERQNDTYGNSFLLNNATLTPFRGLYFNNCDFSISNNIVLNYNFSLQVWIKVVSDGIFLSFGDLLLASYSNGVTLELWGNNHLYDSIGSNWTAIVIQRWINNDVGMVSYRTLSSNFLTSSDGEICILLEGNIQLGSSNLGFSGFIYQLRLYNELIDILEAIILCTSTIKSNCLWECQFNEYYDGSLCQLCKSSCQPCRNPLNCNLCQSSLCQKCTDFVSCSTCIDFANINSPWCTCMDGYYENIQLSGDPQCIQCLDTCNTTCNGALPCDCNDYLFSSKVNIDQCCYTNCPDGFILAGIECYRNSSNILDLNFNTIQYNEILDSYNNTLYIILPGFDYQNSSSMPPFPVQSRGYYFKAQSFAISSHIIINYEFTMQIWMKIVNTGRFLEIDDMQIEAGLGNFTIDQVGHKYVFELFSNDWTVVIIKRWITNGSSYFSMELSGNNIMTLPSLLMCDFLDGPFKLGSGFEGFIWKILFFNEIIAFNETFSLCTVENFVSECAANEYLANSTCAQCQINCSSCVNPNDCNLCYNSLCRSCSNYEICNSCAEDASLVEGICECNIMFYEHLLNPGFSVCYHCQDMCYDYCSGPKACDCNDILYTPKYNIELCCYTKCPTGFELVNGTCSVLNLEIMDFVFDSYAVLKDNFNNSFTYNDTFLTPFRGLYFKTSSYAYSNEMVSSYNFSIHFWVRIASNGTILSMDQLQIQIENPFMIVSLWGNNYSFDYAQGVWCLIEIKRWIESEIGYLSFEIISKHPEIIMVDGVQCNFLDGSLWLGSSTLSFDGFVYRVRIFNDIFDANEDIILCSSDLTENCLWDCNFTDYFDGTQCSSCMENCTTCRNGLNCNLCYSSLCIDCSNFISCNQCSENSYLSEASCICEDGFYTDILQNGDYNCSQCSSNCLKCENFNECFECYEDKFLDGIRCTCRNDQFLNDQEICQDCDSTCSACSNYTYFSCTSCSNSYLLMNICFDICPLGYQAVNYTCLFQKQIISLKYIFKDITGTYYDIIQNISAMAGEIGSSYPFIDEKSPIPAYNRGLYFNSKSYLQFPSPEYSLILVSPQFYMEFWINPYKSGIIFSKKSNTMSAQYDTLLEFNLTIDTSPISFLYNDTVINEKAWNHIIIAVEYDIFTSSFCFMNLERSRTLTMGDEPYLDIPDLGGIIGCDYTKKNCFKGFIYIFALYLSRPEISTLVSSSCEFCQLCVPSEPCLSSCSFSEAPKDKCSNCLSSCNYGCVASNTCSLCADDNCKKCSTFSLYSCLECDYSYSWSGSMCNNCNSTQFYDPQSYSCIDCSYPCLHCTSKTECTSCLGNSTLYNKSCSCEQGYVLTTTCELEKFNAILSITIENIITIHFPKNITSFQPSYILVYVNKVEVPFIANQIDDYSWSIVIKISEGIKKGSKLQIEFINVFEATDKSFYSGLPLMITLYEYNADTTSETVKTVLELSKSLIASSIAMTLGTSAILIDPSSLFTFLSILEIYNYIPLYNCPLSENLVNLLNSMNIDKIAPNAMTYIIDSNYGVKIYGKFNKFGIQTNLFLINGGIYIVGLTSLLLSAIPMHLMYKFCHPWIKGKMHKFIRNYKFNYFTRMWIQSFLDVNIFTSIGMIHNQLENHVQIIDFAFSCLFLSVNIATCFLLVYLIARKHKNINVDNDFIMTWTSFFENCKDIKGPNLYYILFIFRRIVLSIVIIAVPSGVLQLVLSAVASLPVIFT